MKKLVSYLALTAFAVASHMSTVHAWDMFGMEMVHGHAAESGTSIFCDDSPVSTGESDCAKEPFPEKIAASSRTDELPEPETPFVKFFPALALEKTKERIPASKSDAPPRWRASQALHEGDGYLGRIGAEVRKLD